MQNTKTYIVLAKCGHVGRSFYVAKEFPVKAESASKAASMVRHMPRVKHDHKDAILEVRKVKENDYAEAVVKASADPFFHCRSRQEQATLCPNLYQNVQRERDEEDTDFLWLRKQQKRTFFKKKERLVRKEAVRQLFGAYEA